MGSVGGPCRRWSTLDRGGFVRRVRRAGGDTVVGGTVQGGRRTRSASEGVHKCTERKEMERKRKRTGLTSAEKRVQYHADPPNIHRLRLIRVRPAELRLRPRHSQQPTDDTATHLWREIRQTPAALAQQPRLAAAFLVGDLEDGAEAKVGDLEHTRRREQEVFGLEVAVADAGLVEVFLWARVSGCEDKAGGDARARRRAA